MVVKEAAKAIAKAAVICPVKVAAKAIAKEDANIHVKQHAGERVKEDVVLVLLAIKKLQT